MSQQERARAAPAQTSCMPKEADGQLPAPGPSRSALRPCRASRAKATFSSGATEPCPPQQPTATVEDTSAPARLRWARLRFSIVGSLLASPPEPGELASRIGELAAKRWKHPTTGEELRYSAKTLERMYYTIRKDNDPIRTLERKVPSHAGTHPSVTARLQAEIEKQYRQHPSWTYRLHHDNLVVVAKGEPSMSPMPGYATVRRFMKDHGLCRVRRRRHGKSKDSAVELVPRETRSYEVPYVNALWHYDFHEGKRKVLTAEGEWKTPYLLGILDDCSRLCCHAQWYTSRENTEDLVHGLCQGFQKRKLPRSTLSDNGSPMKAAETVEGCVRLSILQYLTLPNSPEQNGKQEHFWTLVEGRLMAMLEGEPALTLELLNTATQAWIEQEYHHTVHSELGKTPLERYLAGPDVGRESPGSDALRRAFRKEITRTQRKSDGTVTVEGVRFEVPSAYRALLHLRLRIARWDLSSIELVEPRTGAPLATLLPLDKAKNADRARRVLADAASAPAPADKPAGIAPLLRELMAEYAATGLPPAYLPKHKKPASSGEEP